MIWCPLHFSTNACRIMSQLDLEQFLNRKKIPGFFLRSLAMDQAVQDIDAEKQTLIPLQEIPPTVIEEPVYGFMYMGFVGNLAINFVFQEVAYLNANFGESFGTVMNMSYSAANNLCFIFLFIYGNRLSFRLKIALSSIGLGFALCAIPLLALSGTRFKMSLAVGLVVLMGVLGSIFSSASSGLGGLCSQRVRKYQNAGASLPCFIAWPLMLVLNKMFDMIKWNITPIDSAVCVVVLFSAAVCCFGIFPYYICVLERNPIVVDVLQKRHFSPEKGVELSEVIFLTLPLALAIWWVTCSQFFVIPDKVLEYKSPNSGNYFGGTNGYPDTLIYVLQASDTLGRFFVAWKPTMLNRLGTIIAAAFRVCLIPLFFLSSGNVWIFKSDIFRILLNVIWGGTYGILISFCYILGPSQVATTQGDTAGLVIAFALENGVVGGSLASMGFKHVLRVLKSIYVSKSECSIGEQFHLVCANNT